ncbi:MAG: hypothetical protein KME55_22545 [Nostoc indistinguendum CM1-VF10]|jgi:hypothetical protein|nr:hypothetical protein [Nostoc indistinguendum CM1-VF10]
MAYPPTGGDRFTTWEYLIGAMAIASPPLAHSQYPMPHLNYEWGNECNFRGVYGGGCGILPENWA